MEKETKQRKATSTKSTKNVKKSPAKKSAPKTKTSNKVSSKSEVKKKPASAPRKKSTRKPLRPELPKLPTSITLRNRLAVVLLSPYRFPIHIETAAISTARVTGIAFVIAGALLAGFNALSLVNDFPSTTNFQVIAEVSTKQAAVVIESESDTSEITSTATTSDEVVIQNTDFSMEVTEDNAEPTLKIITESPYQTNDEITFSIATSEADSVRLFANSAVSNNLFDLGLAEQVESNLWQYTWNTDNQKEGVYILYAEVSQNDIKQETNWERVQLVVGEDHTIVSAGEDSEVAEAEQSEYLVDRMALIIGSIVVVILGLILIILGMYFHVKDREKRPVRKSDSQPGNQPQPQPRQTQPTTTPTNTDLETEL